MLLPCPFCGSSETVACGENHNNPLHPWEINCIVCDIGTRGHSTRAAVVKMWNRRHRATVEVIAAARAEGAAEERRRIVAGLLTWVRATKPDLKRFIAAWLMDVAGFIEASDMGPFRIEHGEHIPKEGGE